MAGQPATSPEVTISVEELARQLESDKSPIVVDVRWALGNPHGHDDYLDGHIPGAIYVDLETELAAPPAGADGGRHPLPGVDDLQASARRWGIDDGSAVVVYDASGNLAAARLWWLLRWAGLRDVRLLDGGWPAWRAAGLPTHTGAETSGSAGSVTLTPGHLPVVTIDDVAAASGLVLDARAGGRYRGEIEPVDPRAGHIPGAVSAPTVDNLDDDGRFLPIDELRERFSTLGAVGADEPVVVYCGSGINAAHQIAAMTMLGIPTALFPGSFSQWSSDPTREVAVGAG